MRKTTLKILILSLKFQNNNNKRAALIFLRNSQIQQGPKLFPTSDFTIQSPRDFHPEDSPHGTMMTRLVPIINTVSKPQKQAMVSATKGEFFMWSFLWNWKKICHNPSGLLNSYCLIRRTGSLAAKRLQHWRSGFSRWIWGWERKGNGVI